MKIRTRFAPSPTGSLHVGGARTALFCYLFARRHEGAFLLRIEDTDRERSTEASVRGIFDSLAWLGLDYDEAPVYQSQRLDRHREVVAQLLAQGHAYHCYCSREELDVMREAQAARGEKKRYDGRCRQRSKPVVGVAPVVRFKNPRTGLVGWHDAVKGSIEVSNAELDDLIIARSDGGPTYNLSVVVDDLDMGITHVVRGDDHVNNTPRQINIYRALQAAIPVFAHVPMILGDDGSRLSKRHGATSVTQYRESGYLPDALLNYLVRLGWSHGDQEVFSRQEMIAWFDLKDVNRAPSSFNRTKLDWLNQQYLQQTPVARLVPELAHQLTASDIDYANGPPLEAVIATFRERATTLAEMAEQVVFLFQDFQNYDEKAANKQLLPAAAEPLRELRGRLAELDSWTPESIQATIHATVNALEIGFGKVGQPLRVAVTGRAAAPGNDQVLALLGRDKALARIDRALTFITQRAAQQ